MKKDKLLISILIVLTIGTIMLAAATVDDGYPYPTEESIIPTFAGDNDAECSNTGDYAVSFRVNWDEKTNTWSDGDGCFEIPDPEDPENIVGTLCYSEPYLSNGRYMIDFVVKDGTFTGEIRVKGGTGYLTYESTDTDGDKGLYSPKNNAGQWAQVSHVTFCGYFTPDGGTQDISQLGNLVWNDLNANGIQDAGEPGISGVTVNLYKCDVTTVFATKETDANGNYMFEKLAPGDYQVGFVLPDGYVFSKKDQGEDDEKDSDADTNGMTVCTDLVQGETDLTWDAGMYQPASLGDFVWEDMNGNGIQDYGEPGIPDATVTLYDCAGNVIGTKTTDANGNYKFDNLVPGQYKVQFTLAAGYDAFSPKDQGSDDAKDSDANPTECTTLEPGENDMSWDAGMYKFASLGDFVWEDMNGNGIQDYGEPGIAGVKVELYECDGKFIDSTTTDEDGYYEFTGLAPGSYYVKFGTPTGYYFTKMDVVGSDDAVDSDADAKTGMTACVTLTSGQTDNTIDAGMYKPATLGDFVWNDMDRDGIQDDGEHGVAGVTVELYECDGKFIDSTTTDEDGYYEFTGLAPGKYSVKFVLPEGAYFSLKNVGDDALDSDADTATGMTECTTLVSGETDLTWDAGMYRFMYETAYAKGNAATCFIPTFANWGWTNLISATGTQTWNLYAGAGQCDETKGTFVGTVTVIYEASKVSVDYNVIMPYSLEETHVYAGTTMFPQVKQGKQTVDTVAPGQYYNNGGFTGSVYVIAHAVVGIPDPNFGLP